MSNLGVLSVCGAYMHATRVCRRTCRCASIIGMDTENRSIPHGTLAGHRTYGCRCWICCSAQRAAADKEPNPWQDLVELLGSKPARLQPRTS